MTDEHPDTITVRLNSELFERASASAEYGIPVYAGVPLALDFAELGSSPRCCWFRLDGDTHTRDIRLCPIEQPSGTPADPSEISLDDLVADVAAKATELTWYDVVEAFKHLRSDHGRASPWQSFGGYKPFHVLVWASREAP